MNSRNQIERIKIKLRLAKNTDAFFEVFGARSHKYVLDAPLSNTEIIDFEKKYNITLPKTYRTFLAEIGNGRQNPSALTLLEIAEGIGCEVHEFFEFNQKDK